jgi:hypothetical protein
MRTSKYMKRSRKSRNLYRHTQKLWKQKGCSKSMTRRGGGCNCKLPFMGGKKMSSRRYKKGGGCSSCPLQQMQKGGCTSCSSSVLLQSGGSHLPSLPPALVGAPWTPAIGGWPGVAGQSGVTNHYSMNNYKPFDPQTQVMSERAGPLFLGKYTGGCGKCIGRKNRGRKSRGCKSRGKRGGGLIPQDLVNFGRTLTYGLGSAYNSVNGYSQPVSPLPYKDQLVNTVNIN